jgi:oxygen-independent coproporphyrinogen-3 oxidase
MDIAQLIAKYDVPVPRYTSYPTAPQFGPAVDAAVYAGWLAALPDAPVSLYLHVPFCAELCWYCGCHTTAVHRPEPMEAYADTLLTEIDLLAAAIGRPLAVAHLHWGGGTPHALPPRRMTEVMRRLRERFAFGPHAEIAVEIDPRTLSPESVAALGEMGCNRASLGVQDFDERVGKAVNRIQSYAVTEAAATALRRAGVHSINLDLMYGLPYQTEESVATTIGHALDLTPDRVAVFGYAHVPWMKKHQELIPEAALPGAEERFAQLCAAEATITGRGYQAIGLDHYALPDDTLAVAARDATLKRNFQGYTTDTAPILLGLGASSIGALPQGYVQNAAPIVEYRDRVRAGGLPIKRGLAITAEDLLRRDVIETLMCQGNVDLDAVAAWHGVDPAGLKAAGPQLAAMAADGLIEWDGRRITMRPAARAFVRNVACAFDAYYRPQPNRHARAV